MEQNGQNLRVASLGALLKKSKLCNSCMTQNCSAHTNMRLKICLHGLFICPTYSTIAHHTSYALRNPIHMPKVLSHEKDFQGKELLRVHAY